MALQDNLKKWNEVATHAWQIKKALDQVELAKMNAERAKIGLDPIRPWYCILRIQRFHSTVCLGQSRYFEFQYDGAQHHRSMYSHYTGRVTNDRVSSFESPSLDLDNGGG